MNSLRAFVTGIGILTPAGRGLPATLGILQSGKSTISPLSLFPYHGEGAMPVGQIHEELPDSDLPRAHQLALEAARDAMAETDQTPDAIILGVTTGGMSTTEVLLQQNEVDQDKYRLHGSGTIAEVIAEATGCTGPSLTVSTACSSSAVALKIALEMIRRGEAKTVLAGGVDSLCRLTVHGFHSLQLTDPEGARPFDAEREGMSVAEAAAMLLIQGAPTPPPGTYAEITGGGLSCDAHHATSPHPEGKGALAAMQAALDDAGLQAQSVSYVNLHGTGTKGNDASEAKAVSTLFGDTPPPISSTKGIFGHPLAAAGALEAIIASLCINNGFVPPNVGLRIPDPEIVIRPAQKPLAQNVETVLSNSFGFGGNNASLIISKAGLESSSAETTASNAKATFSVLRCACITGAGALEDTLKKFSANESCTGMADGDLIAEGLPPRMIRRLKRLPRMVLSLAKATVTNVGEDEKPGSIFFGTGWGPLSETGDFLDKLFESGEKFGSAIDFAGSVHNAPAGQAALMMGATGPNVTATGGDASFEQALLMAGQLASSEKAPVLIVGTDEGHEKLTRLFDPSTKDNDALSDGGGALLLSTEAVKSNVEISLLFYCKGEGNPDCVSLLAEAAGDMDDVDTVFAGIPAADRSVAENQLEAFQELTGYSGSIVDFRKLLGEHPSTMATATTLAVKTVQKTNKRILLLGLGKTVTAMLVKKSAGGNL